MSVHFGYNYKYALIKKLQDRYAPQIKTLEEAKRKQALLDDAERMIRDFFNGSKRELSALSDASDGMVEYIDWSDDFIARLSIYPDYIQFTRSADNIVIEHGEIDSRQGMTKLHIYGYIEPADRRCILKKVGKVHDGSSFDENVINSYIRKTFSGILDGE